MKALKNRTFDEYLVVLGTFAFGIALLVNAYFKHNSFSVIAGVLLLFSVTCFVCGVFSARLVLIGFYLFVGLHRLILMLMGISPVKVGALVMAVVPFYFAYHFVRWKNYRINPSDSLEGAEPADADSRGLVQSTDQQDDESGIKEDRSFNLAFILLEEARLPDPRGLEQAFQLFAASGESLKVGEDGAGGEAASQVMSMELSTGEKSFVSIMPSAVPNGEAEHNVQFSLSAFKKGWVLPAHSAHLIVMFMYAPDTPPVVSLSRFTSLLAAIAKASPAAGIYWGNASATHDPAFFTTVAVSQGIVPRMMLWTGVSVAREKDGRLSLLSLGMNQLALPDLILVAGKSSEAIALETMFDLLAYVAERSKALPEGDTVGRSDEEKLPVHYVVSPADPSKKVWRVELP